MGQCYATMKNKSRWRRRRQYRHKRFDFTPRRSWKYKDAQILNEFHDISMDGDGEEHADEGGSAFVIENRIAQVDSDEEVDTGGGEVRQSGRLVFTEVESEEEEEEGGAGEGESEKTDQQQHSVPVEKPRTLSNTSEQVGRFEVVAIATPHYSSEEEEEGGEARKLKAMISERDTANLIANEVLA